MSPHNLSLVLGRIGGGVFAFAAGVGAAAQTTDRVSVDSTGVQADSWSYSASVSGNGQFVAFMSNAANLVANDTNGEVDIFVHDRGTGITERANVRTSGKEANRESADPAISADGSTVAFASYATNLVQGDTNGTWDVFVRDRAAGTTTRVSVDSSGAEANGSSRSPALSADGRFVVFTSSASNLVAGDTNGKDDIFVHDRATGSTERVSVDSAGNEGDDDSYRAELSGDGLIVVMESRASNLVAGDTNTTPDIFVHDRSTGITERLNVDANGGQEYGWADQSSISADGMVVAWATEGWNLVAGDTNNAIDVFVHDRATGTTERVSVDSSGNQVWGGSSGTALSADGEIVAFGSVATDLVAGDTNGHADIFIHDRRNGITQRVSIDSTGAQGDRDSGDEYSTVVAISGDGRVVAFFSSATNLVAGDTNALDDIFVHEIDLVDATWTNYGSGFAGTLGVPAFTSQTDPLIGTTVTLDLSNSSGGYSPGLLFLGSQRTSIHSVWGGDLLALPTQTLIIAMPPSGVSFTGAIPADENFCGVTLDLQAIELDPGALHGVSFTAGLELVLGR